MTRSFKKLRSEQSEAKLHDKEFLTSKRNQLAREMREEIEKLREYLKLKGELDG